ncbi:MAG: c-type cytochrome [Ginsengibacter sp.]
MKTKQILIVLFFITAIIIAAQTTTSCHHREKTKITVSINPPNKTNDSLWIGKDSSQIPINTDSGKLILYGYKLIVNTAFYLGPKGIVAHVSNGMNCENCHLNGGTKPFGNNFGKVYSTYPKFRDRNNSVQTIYDRINDCFVRSLNGKALDSSSHEMRAIYAYIKWLGEDVPKGVTSGGTSFINAKYLDKPADPIAGKQVFIMECQNCHGKNGEGLVNTNGIGYTFPPLWGKNSYNNGAGLYRLIEFTDFVKNNMPFGTSWQHPVLTDTQAWNVAAFVNSQPRPLIDQSMDWKDIADKPIDFPYGPYADSFSEKQHKYGPFKPIQNEHQKNNKKSF